jgi:serine/threonine-protein kinase
MASELGEYRIVRAIGEGGTGVVYLAERKVGGLVAIKLLRDAWLSPARRERFSREQRTLAQLDHPSIARLYDAGALADGTPFFVMEYVDGRPLTDHCREYDKDLEERLRLFRALCEGVIHRDIKPSNVLVKRDGGIRLLDFGIAKHLESVGGGADSTRTGLRLMTPAYAAPERFRGERAGIGADVYSLGVVLYELLTSRLPLDLSNCTLQEAERRVLQENPPRPSQGPRPPGAGRWDADIDVLVLTAMHKDPRRRYRSVEELIRDIDHHLRREPLEARPDSGGYRLRKFASRNAREIAVAGAALVCAGAVFAIILVAAPTSVLRWRPDTGGAEVAAASLAVLPFEDGSEERDQAYLADGITEEIRSGFARVNGLRLAGRSSSIRVGKGKGPNVTETGRLLDVRAVLTGRVQRVGNNNLRLAAELVATKDGKLLWSQSFDRPMPEMYSVQDEITRAVTSALHLPPSRERAPSTKGHRTYDPEAYRLYLLGHYWGPRLTKVGNGRAVEYFRQALAIDAGYAPAHAELAAVLVAGTAYATSAGEVREDWRQIVAEAQKAVELAPDLSQARTIRGYVNLSRLDWHDARDDLARALELNPSDPVAHRRMGVLLSSLGRFSDGLAALRRAAELDPLDPSNWNWFCRFSAARGDFAGARKAALRSLATAPEQEDAARCLANLALLEGDPAGALAMVKDLPKGEDQLVVEALASYSLGRARQSTEATGSLITKFAHSNPLDIAIVHAWRGDRDLAFKWLDTAFEYTDDIFVTNVDPFLGSLRDDPRWTAFARRLNIPREFVAEASR